MRPDKKRYYILSAKINFREFKPHIPPLDLPLIILRDVAVRIQCSVGGGGSFVVHIRVVIWESIAQVRAELVLLIEAVT